MQPKPNQITMLNPTA